MNTNVATMAYGLGVSTMLPDAESVEEGGVRRTELQRKKLAAPGYELVQLRIELAPGAIASPHMHPGDEITFLLEGSMEYRVGTNPPVRLTGPNVFFMPAGIPHSAANVGAVPATEITSFVVESGKPFATPAELPAGRM